MDHDQWAETRDFNEDFKKIQMFQERDVKKLWTPWHKHTVEPP